MTVLALLLTFAFFLLSTTPMPFLALLVFLYRTFAFAFFLALNRYTNKASSLIVFIIYVGGVIVALLYLVSLASIRIFYKSCSFF